MTIGLERPTERDAKPSLRQLVQRGAFWSFLSYGGSQGLRLLGNLVLTRLLFEEAFGLMALVSVFLVGLALFSDIGIGPSIIQNERGDDQAFLDTAFTLQAARGLALWTCSAIGAAPFAGFYREPELLWLVPAAGSTAFIAGLNSTKLFTANRHLAMRSLAVIEIGTQIAGLAVMVTWALVDRSVWALVSGGIASALLKMILSHALLPGPNNRFRWEPAAMRQLIRFGRWIFLSTVMTFFTSHSDRLIFGKLIPTDVLGVYSIGATLAGMPSSALSHLGGNVLFPLYSKIHNEKGDLLVIYRRTRWMLLVIGGWALAGFIAGGQVIVDILYDRRYSGAGWIVQLLAISGWFVILESTAGVALLARGKAAWVAGMSTAKLVGMIVLIPLGHAAFGFPGAVAGYSASEILRYAVSARGAVRYGLGDWRRDIVLIAWVTATSLAGSTLARHVADGFGSIVAAVSIFFVMTLAWGPFAWIALRTYRAARESSER